MSRCLPFPPPGYEKKARIEDTALLTKAKHKEKKHKKDKKKREGTEKKNKDKERSKKKHNDKKDRKEKHRDERDRLKDNDKNWTVDAKRIEGRPECNNGDKIGPNSIQNNKISNSKYVQDLARRIREDDRATSSQIGQKIIVTDHRRGELPGRMVEHCINNRLEEEEKAKEKKVNGQRNHIEVRSSGNAIFSGFSVMDQKRYRGVAKPVEKNDIGKQVEEKEENKLRESYNKDSKHKDRDREKKSGSKDESRDKEKQEKVKEVSEKSKDRLKLKDSCPKLKDSCKAVLNSYSTKPLDVLKMGSNTTVCEGILGKRTELEINGILHGESFPVSYNDRTAAPLSVPDNGNRCNKLPTPFSSSCQGMENGRKFEPCHANVHLASEWEGEIHNYKVDMKECKNNGLIKILQPIVCSSGSLSTKARVSENGEASVKPRRPDSKYLNQILSVPKLEDFSDLDDQEWLFSSDSVQSKKAKMCSSEGDGTPLVWSEALQIVCADLTALPFVIPF